MVAGMIFIVTNISVVTMTAVCGNGSLGGGTHLIQSHGEHLALTLSPLFVGLPRYPQGFTLALYK